MNGTLPHAADRCLKPNAEEAHINQNQEKCIRFEGVVRVDLVVGTKTRRMLTVDDARRGHGGTAVRAIDHDLGCAAGVLWAEKRDKE